jgi:hypothetical protein
MSYKNHSEQAGTSSDLSINDLPQEILIQIFKNLSQNDLLKNTSMLSKYINNLCKDRSLPVSVDIESPFYLGLPKEPRVLAERGQQIKYLTLTYIPPKELKVNISDATIRLFYFSIMCEVAHTITLPQGYLSQVFQGASVLKKFVVRIKEPLCLNQSNEIEQIDDFFKRPSVFPTAIQDISGIGNCKVLEHLDVYLLGVNLSTLKEIVSLPKLKLLHIRVSAEVTPDQFVQVMSTARLFELKELFIHFVAVTDQCLMSIGEMCPNLERLRVQSQQKSDIGLDGVRTVTEKCAKLQKLTIFKLDLGDYYEKPVINAWKNDAIIKKNMNVQCLRSLSFAEFTKKKETVNKI